MSNKFPGKKNSKRAGKFYFPASILSSTQRLEDYSGVGYTLKARVRSSRKPIGIEIIRRARREPYHRRVKFSLHIDLRSGFAGKAKCAGAVRMLMKFRSIGP